MLLLTITSSLPPRWQPYAKAIVPAILAVLAALIHGLTTGSVRSIELEIAVVGLAAAALSAIVANGPKGLAAYAKALVPATLTIVAVVAHWLILGEWDQAQWTLAITGLGAALVTLLVPNLDPGTDDVDPDVPLEALPTDEDEFASPPPLDDDEVIPGTDRPASSFRPDPETLP